MKYFFSIIALFNIQQACLFGADEGALGTGKITQVTITLIAKTLNDIHIRGKSGDTQVALAISTDQETIATLYNPRTLVDLDIPFTNAIELTQKVHSTYCNPEAAIGTRYFFTGHNGHTIISTLLTPLPIETVAALYETSAGKIGRMDIPCVVYSNK